MHNKKNNGDKITKKNSLIFFILFPDIFRLKGKGEAKELVLTPCPFAQSYIQHNLVLLSNKKGSCTN